MTGEPSFTFRGRDATPDCPDCGTAMSFRETREDPDGEVDVYGCAECGTRFADRWTF